ncbi:hypothetical protein C2S53_010049 [Perilla frutescens var. hirtella]|uniref:RING-type E3 ubiquitin transferase n=1 Tax=Perilla frutescens var. hirtella TaxID=608512 RepID=A0AAD4JBK3_PERFH|nr:hypothetical protein C2S53_010049 [Perilla frutescens var. hirtella]
MGFEYRYRFSVDEDIISRFGSWYGEDVMKYVFEIRTTFIVKGRFDGGAAERIIDSEKYEIADFEGGEKYLREDMSVRLKDYWMSNDEIQRLLNEAFLFAAADGRRGMIPVAVDLDVCTVQREGEAIEAVVDRAMRPELLYPIYLCPVNQHQRPKKREDRPPGYEADDNLMKFLRYELPAIRVEDVEKGLYVIEECGVCGRKPIFGTQISELRCGHAFHNHCIVRWLEDDNSCPICHQQAYHEPCKDSSAHCDYVIDEDDYDRFFS